MSRDFIKKQKKKVDLKEVEKLLLQEEHSVYENARTESSQLSKLDFGSGVLYVQPEAIHTRKDGARGVYIYLERHDMKKVAFVPLLKCKPRGETLRQQIPLFEATADDVDTKIKTIEADLEMYEEEWDASQKLIANAEMQQLEHQLIVQKALISNKKKQLEIEEAKGICIRYSLADTEGKQLAKDDIYMTKKVKLSERDQASEIDKINVLHDNMTKQVLDQVNTMQILSVETKRLLIETLEMEKANVAEEHKCASREEFSEINIF